MPKGLHPRVMIADARAEVRMRGDYWELVEGTGGSAQAKKITIRGGSNVLSKPGSGKGTFKAIKYCRFQGIHI